MATVRYTTINGEVIAEKRGGVRSLYVPDPLGSTVALLDSTQSQTDTFSYWPYGENRTRTGTTATPLQFVGTKGCRRDSPSKTYMRARTLDAVKARWMTQDPLGFSGGDANLYRYVANKATSTTDPSGTVPGDRYGDDLCRRIHHSGNWHSCSVPQWKSCLTYCRGRSNVKYCCSDASPFGGPVKGPHRNCQCIKPPPSNVCKTYPGDDTTQPPYPWGTERPITPAPPARRDNGGWQGPFFPQPYEDTGDPNPSHDGPPRGQFGPPLNPPGPGDVDLPHY